jgi:ribose transport system ATP-binding protein
LDPNIILRVEGIDKSFPGTQALSQVHLDVSKGEVHGLVGENGAGKSTLMNIISGVHQPDRGKIVFLNREVFFNNPCEAQEAGIGFVHQELSLCQHISVAENIFMGRLPEGPLGFINKRKLYKATQELLDLFKTTIKPTDITLDLNVAEQQIVEIAKSLSLDCKLLILDEPTSSLTKAETITLYQIIRDLKKRGMAVLFISHRMADIFEVCDYVTVLRDGKFVNTFCVAETTSDKVVSNMVGREINQMYPDKSEAMGDELLRVCNLNRGGFFRNINFYLKRGEILGFSGLVGAGRTEVARAVCGIDPIDEGEVYLNGQKLDISCYSDALREGVCYLTEDRKRQGLFLKLSVQQNITVTEIDNISRHLLIPNDKELEIASTYVDKLGIKVSGLRQKVDSLSGGNQQKVMLAKWLSLNPKVIFMDEPTRGIDIGSKVEIHNMLRRLAKEGIGIIVISSELPEIIGMCDRVIVMHEGVISGEVTEAEICENKIIRLASGQ